ncbi:MAG: JAB domain-containing protein [Planctomycetota bacterium]|nr:JAB domain-containing protein [Planctomycetota bacterium]
MWKTVTFGMLVSSENDTNLLSLALGAKVELESCNDFLGIEGTAGLLRRCPIELGSKLKINTKLATQLAAALELGRRAVLTSFNPKTRFRGGGDVHRYLAPRFAGQRKEQFYALYLDAKGGVLHEERLSEGTLTTSLVHPREVFAPAVLHRAATIVVAHNHPSGDAEVSAEDRSTTRRLQRVGRLLGIEILDHVVLGAGCYTSFLEEGWL